VHTDKKNEKKNMHGRGFTGLKVKIVLMGSIRNKTNEWGKAHL